MISAARLLLVAVAGLCVLPAFVASVEDFPPPPMPHRPRDFNIHCDVCHTMMKRVVPYCQREEENMDFLPDFCTFNYNKVLRKECDFLVDVMEYAWCPNACAEVRKIQLFTGDKICVHPLVNCTERVIVPSPSPSPSPSASSPIPADCVLCEFVLKHAATMCMNREMVNQRNVYHMCMEKTQTRQDFEHCTTFLNELVALAGTEDPCDMLSCAEPRVTCQADENSSCHVVPYTGTATEWSNLGLTENGDLMPTSAFAGVQGLGPGDFKPGVKPYHSANVKRMVALPPNVRVPGHLLTPRDDAVDEAEKADLDKVNEENSQAKTAPVPTPIPLQDVKMQ